jgi:hypothetical protein
MTKSASLRLLLSSCAVILSCSGSTGPKADETWPEIMVLPIRVTPVNANGAGDVVFSAQLPIENRPFLEMGATVASPTGPKQLPNFEFYVAAGAEVVSPVNGVVIDVVAHSHVADFGVLIARTANSRGVWVEVDHITNPRVVKGSVVTAGQVIGNAGLSSRDQIGRVELQISKSDGNKIRHFCPNLAFAASERARIESEITTLMAAVEAWSGNSNNYNQAAMFRPGCNLEVYTEG